MFNILSKTVTPQEMLLLKSLEPDGANLSIHPEKIFSENYIIIVLIAFNEGKPFLNQGSLRKAIKSAKSLLSKMINDYTPDKFLSEYVLSGVVCENL